MNKTIKLYLSLFSLTFLFYCIYQISIPLFNNNNQVLFFPNNSIFGILIASQIAFVIPLYDVRGL